MNRLLLFLFCSLPVVAPLSCTSPTSFGGIEIGNIIAHYPLTSTPNDTLGKQAPMILRDTPFQEGGIYCNGTYPQSHAVTPELDSLDFRAFTISAWFKVREYVPSSLPGRPVFVGGNWYRWLGFTLRPDSTISLLYNNSSHVHTNTRYRLNVWHRATISYDSTTRVGRIYLDGRPVDSAMFSLNHGDNKNVGTTNFANGTAFRGISRDLKIYNEAITTRSGIQEQ